MPEVELVTATASFAQGPLPDVEARERPRVLLVHNKLTPFVAIDRDLLRERYHVEELAVAGDAASPLAAWRAVRRADAVVCWFASAHSLVPSLLGRLLGRPVVAIVGGYDTANMPEIGYGHQRGGLKKYVTRATMALATRLVTNSRYTCEEAVREAGARADKITVVYHGIPFATHGEGDSQGLSTKEEMVLTVGNVDRANLWRKGLEPFVQAAGLLPGLRFVLVGAWLDEAIDHLRAIAPPNVTFAGRVSDAELDAYLRRAAVYVQASAHEGFGVSLAQAMAAGCVPVITRAGALPEVVGDAGVYAASAAPTDLAAAITDALAAAPELGAAARARVAAQFTMRRRLDGLAGVIDGALCAAGHKAGDSRQRTEPDAASDAAPRAEGARGSDSLPGADGAGHVARYGPVAIPGERDAAEKSAEELPLVSVVIPARNEEKTIADCLDAVLAQDYPPARMEVLVVDGRSADATRAVVQDVAAADAWSRVRLLDNPRGIAPTALNAGIRAARGEVIARVDGHTIIAPDYLRRCVEALASTGADNVGGLMRPQGRGYAGECIAIATGSRFGIGNSRFHYDERGGEADTVYLGCFRRAIFARVGLFDETLVRNQDDELNDRILEAGGRIWLDPRIRSTYFNRGSLRALWRQYYQYGYWKVRVLRRHPHARRLRHLAPSTLVLGLGSSALAALLGALWWLPRPLRRLAAWPAALAWGAYAAGSLGAATQLARQAGWRYLPGLALTFWCLHVSYGAGFLAGLLAERYGDISDRPAIPRLESQDAAGAPADCEVS